jgi:octaprenyl-diphosphate synthase
MHRFGEMVGMAFQIVDDILDYTPDNNTGKPAANDLQERKITLPLIEVLEKVTPELKRDILSAVERAATDSAAVDFVRQQVVEYGGVEAARATLQRFLQRALSELSALEDTPYRQALIDLCTFVAERDR